MASDRKTRPLMFGLLIALCMAVCPKAGICLITGEDGNNPVNDRGWPPGSVEVANLPSRLGYWEGPPFGGGEYHFLYRCENTEQFNDALKSFAAIEASKLELLVHNGPEHSFWLRVDNEQLPEADARVDWTFTVWIPQSWNRLYNNPKSLFAADHPNFRKPVAPPRIDLYIGGGSVIWVDVDVPENVTVIDKRPGSISPQFAGMGLVQGRVFDMATGKPIAGARIELAKRLQHEEPDEVISGTTDDNGCCQIAKIPASYYEVRIRAEGYASRKHSNYSNQRPEYYQFETELARSSFIKGTVNDLDGNPIEGVRVSAQNVIGPDGFGYPPGDDSFVTTDKYGRFEIRNLPTGTTHLSCRGQSWYLTNSVFEVYQIPSESVKLTMTRTGTIRGQVVDREGKRPPGEIHLNIGPAGEIRLGKWGWSGQLSEDGTFDIDGVPPGRYVISTRPNPSRSDYEPNAQEITVEAGKTYEVEILHVAQSPKLRARGPRR